MGAVSRRARPTQCLRPDLAPITAYCDHGCRCLRGIRAEGAGEQACERCIGQADVQVDGELICWGCVTTADRQVILADSYRGRYGRLGTQPQAAR